MIINILYNYDAGQMDFTEEEIYDDCTVLDAVHKFLTEHPYERSFQIEIRNT